MRKFLKNCQGSLKETLCKEVKTDSLKSSMYILTISAARLGVKMRPQGKNWGASIKTRVEPKIIYSGLTLIGLRGRSASAGSDASAHVKIGKSSAIRHINQCITCKRRP